MEVNEDTIEDIVSYLKEEDGTAVQFRMSHPYKIRQRTLSFDVQMRTGRHDKIWDTFIKGGWLHEDIVEWVIEKYDHT